MLSDWRSIRRVHRRVWPKATWLMCYSRRLSAQRVMRRGRRGGLRSLLHPRRVLSLARAVVVLMTYFRVRVATSTISMTISRTRRTRPMWVLGTARVVLVAPATAPVQGARSVDAVGLGAVVGMGAVVGTGAGAYVAGA